MPGTTITNANSALTGPVAETELVIVQLAGGPLVTGGMVAGAAASSLLVTDSAGKLQSGPSTASLASGSQPAPGWLLVQWALVQNFALSNTTRNASEVITTASVAWPDGATGVFTSTSINATFDTIDAFTVTYVWSGGADTITQAAVTRDSNGAVIAQPMPTVA
jgi:hypothetical protein